MPGFDLENYPTPVVGLTEEERERDPEELILLRGADYALRMKDLGFNYTVEGLKGTPAAAAAETAGYGDAHYLNHLDNVALAVLSPSHSDGELLDLCVARSGTKRLPGEIDVELRERDRLNRKGKSAAGPDDYYKAKAREVSSRIRDVAVGEPIIQDHSTVVLPLSVLTHDNNGTPEQPLLSQISQVLNAKNFTKRGIVVLVRGAVIEVVNVHFVLWLYRDGVAPPDPDQKLRTAFGKAQRLDFDLTESWIHSVLHDASVQRVELPNWQDRFAPFDRALALGDVTYEIKRAA